MFRAGSNGIGLVSKPHGKSEGFPCEREKKRFSLLVDQYLIMQMRGAREEREKGNINGARMQIYSR